MSEPISMTEAHRGVLLGMAILGATNAPHAAYEKVEGGANAWGELVRRGYIAADDGLWSLTSNKGTMLLAECLSGVQQRAAELSSLPPIYGEIVRLLNERGWRANPEPHGWAFEDPEGNRYHGIDGAILGQILREAALRG